MNTFASENDLVVFILVIIVNYVKRASLGCDDTGAPISERLRKHGSVSCLIERFPEFPQKSIRYRTLLYQFGDTVSNLHINCLSAF